jgi:hypothetical protein
MEKSNNDNLHNKMHEYTDKMDEYQLRFIIRLVERLFIPKG